MEALEPRQLLSLSAAHDPLETAAPGPAPPPAYALAGFDRLDLDATLADPSRVLVRFRSAADAEQAALRILPGAEVSDPMPVVDGLRQVTLPAGVSPREALAMLSRDSAVLYAEPDYRLHIDGQVIPNDPSFASQWGLNNTGQSGGTADADIDAPEAWNFTTGSAATVVAVVDTGVDYNHPDLAANIWVNAGEIPGNGIDDDGNGYVDDVRGWNFVADSNDPMDDHGHGTHVAGTIGAVGNNGLGVAGVAWNVQIMPLKILDASGTGTVSDAIAALQYAVDNGATVSNHSYGDSEPGAYSQAFRDAIQAAAAANHVFVAAAGNETLNIDSTPSYPAAYDLGNILSVAATDRNDALASFSNYGTTGVDLAAPGVTILSTLPASSYGWMSGTSMATPHVTGAVALVQSLHPGWTYTQVIDEVLGAVDSLPSLAGKVQTGGRLNVGNAVAPPRVLSASPSGSVAGPVDRVVVTFSKDIPADSFTAQDVVELSGPSGPIGSFAVTRLGRSQFAVTFAQQTQLGTYRLMIGPAIQDQVGTAMDQDQDGIVGEATDDRFTATFAITGSSAGDHFDFGTATSPLADGYTRVSGSTAYSSSAGFGWQSGTIRDYDRGTGTPLTRDFNYTGQGTFAVDVPAGDYQVAVTLGDVGVYLHDQMGVFLEGTQVDSVTTAAGQVVTRSYTVTVNDGQLTLLLKDLGGSDSNVVIEGLDVISTGPPPPDTTGPRITQASPTGSVAGPVSQVDLTFSEAILAGTFTTGAVTLTGPSGAITPSQISQASSTQYAVVFPAQSAAGTYTLVVAPTIQDLAGNLMDQDQDGNQGEPVDDRFTGSFSIAPAPPLEAKYDFGTATSPLESGYTRVTSSTRYTGALAYGWQSGSLREADRGSVGTALARDFNYSSQATFAVDLPNGSYNVTVTLGDLGAYAHDQMGVFLEGTKVDSVSTAAGQVVTRTYTATVSDGQLTVLLRDLGGSDSNVVIEGLTVGSASAPPAANDDAYTAGEDAPLVVAAPGVLANDTDPNSGDVLTVVAVDTTGLRGSLSWSADGSFTYNPNGQFESLAVGQSAVDRFGYTAGDGHGGADAATVTITVAGANDAPVAQDAAFSVTQDGSHSGMLSASDVDSGDRLTFRIETPPAHGTLTSFDAASGAFTYAPASGYVGSDSFTFRANDTRADSNLGAVSVTVGAVNHPPTVANPMADVAVSEDAADTVISIAGVFADADLPNDALTYSVTVTTPVAALVSQVDVASYTHIHQDLLYTHSGQSRGLGGAQHDLARDNIRDYFRSLGLTTTLEPFTYSGQTYYNVVATKPGAVRPNEVYLVGAHYDSASTPGADDNGSGTAAVMEIARVLSRYTFDATLVFVAFDREEQGLVGSTAYASAHAADDIRGMVDLDMIAFNPDTANKNRVKLYDGNGAGNIKSDLTAAFAAYGNGVTATNGGTASNSDHWPFEQRGFDAAMAIEYEFSLNPNYHRSTDAVETANYIDYAYAANIAGAVTGYLATAAALGGGSQIVSASIVGGNLVLDYAANLNGEAQVTVRATDSAGAWAEDTLDVTVAPVNDAPVVAQPIADVTVDQGSASTVVSLADSFTDADVIPNGDWLTFTVAGNTTPGLVTTTLSGSQLTLSYAADQNGTADITVRAADSTGAFVEDTFRVTVNPVAPPAFPSKFDFGTASSPVASGYLQVTKTTTYTTSLGYGWQSGTISDYDRGVGTALVRDFNYTKQGTFAVALPNASYDVTVTLGDVGAYAHDQMGVFLEGTQVDSVSTAAGQVVTRTYRVAVADGQLTLLLRDLGGSDTNVVIESLELVQVSAGPDTTPPTVTARTPAPGATVTAMSVNVDVTFSEAVVGVDATDLVLSGAAAAGAAVAAPVNTGGNTWRFPVSGLAQGTLNLSLAPDAGDIEDAAGNDLANLAWSYAVDLTTPAFSAKFDFGTAASPLEPGYNRVSRTTTYSAVLGYGWQNGTIYDYDRGTGTALTRDFNYTKQGTFAVAVANATYDVSLSLGDLGVYAHDQMGVFLEGTQVDSVTSSAGQVLTRTYRVSVADGQLTVLLRDLGGSDQYVVIEGLAVTGVSGGTQSLRSALLGSEAVLALGPGRRSDQPLRHAPNLSLLAGNSGRSAAISSVPSDLRRDPPTLPGLWAAVDGQTPETTQSTLWGEPLAPSRWEAPLESVLSDLAHDPAILHRLLIAPRAPSDAHVG